MVEDGARQNDFKIILKYNHFLKLIYQILRMLASQCMVSHHMVKSGSMALDKN